MLLRAIPLPVLPRTLGTVDPVREGCGVPRNFMKNLRSAVGQTIAFCRLPPLAARWSRRVEGFSILPTRDWSGERRSNNERLIASVLVSWAGFTTSPASLPASSFVMFNAMAW